MDLCVKAITVELGAKRSREQIINGECKMLIVANSFHSEMKSELEYLSMMTGTPLYSIDGDCFDLGRILKRKHGINVASVSNFGIADHEMLLKDCIWILDDSYEVTFYRVKKNY